MPGERPHPKGGGQDRDGRVRADSYPAAVFCAPDGERVGEPLWGIIPPERFLSHLKELVAAHPKLFPIPPEEQHLVQRADSHP